MVPQPSAVPRRSDLRPAWSLVPLAVGSLAAALAAVGARRSFSLAEVESVLQAHRPWAQLEPFEHANASGSLYLVALKGWLHLGADEWIVRAPSIAACGLTAVAVFLLAARLVDRWAGAAAGAAFALSAYALQFGRAAEPLAPAVLALALATLVFVVALDTGSAWLWPLYIVLAVAAAYLHSSTALALPAHAAAVVARGGPRRRAGWSVAVALLAAAPAAAQATIHRRQVLDPLAQPGLADVARAVHDVSGRNVALLVAATVGVLSLVASRVVNAEPWKATLLVGWTALPLTGILALSIVRPSFDARYLAVSAPAWSVLAGAGVRALRRELALALAIAVAAVGGARAAQLVRQTPENWRGAVTAAFAGKKPENRVVAAPAPAIGALSYYAGRDRGSTTAGGPISFVLARGRTAEDAIGAARGVVRPPAYALRAQRRWGRRLWLQRWERTGLPPR